MRWISGRESVGGRCRLPGQAWAPGGGEKGAGLRGADRPCDGVAVRGTSQAGGPEPEGQPGSQCRLRRGDSGGNRRGSGDSGPSPAGFQPGQPWGGLGKDVRTVPTPCLCSAGVSCGIGIFSAS